MAVWVSMHRNEIPDVAAPGAAQWTWLEDQLRQPGRDSPHRLERADRARPEGHGRVGQLPARAATALRCRSSPRGPRVWFF